MSKKKVLASFVFAIAIAASSTPAFAWHCRGNCKYTVWEATPVGGLWVTYHTQVHGRAPFKQEAKDLMYAACGAYHGWAVVRHRCSTVEIVEEILIGQAGEEAPGEAVAAASLQDSCAAVNELIDDERFSQSCSQVTREAPPNGRGTVGIVAKPAVSGEDLSAPATLGGKGTASLALPSDSIN